MNKDLYVGRRLSYDGYLCTVRYYGPLQDTKGEWLGVEWDDTSRGKHNGNYLGQQVFRCLSTDMTPASFLRPTRRYDQEKTILEAIESKYTTKKDDLSPYNNDQVVIISGKVAEEVGFEKITRRQSQLNDLKFAILEDLVVCGLVPKNSNRVQIADAQRELEMTCPNITELDIGWNPIETWQDVVDICCSLPKLRVLRTNGLRLRSVQWFATDGRKPFTQVQELYLDECLISLDDVADILLKQSEVPMLTTLSLSKNGFNSIRQISLHHRDRFSSVRTLLLENNELHILKDLSTLFSVFPQVSNLSFQGNSISSIDLPLEEPAFFQLETLNISHNNIDSWPFVDSLPRIFPNLSSLRISNNPLYEKLEPVNFAHGKASERSYYLTLARIPKLINLNYTKISLRDREEGELYYLSVVEKEIKDMIPKYSVGNSADTEAQIREVKSAFPQYERLCLLHHREPVLKRGFSEDSGCDMNFRMASLEKHVSVNYPKGSLGSRLIDATFYLQHNTEDSFRRLIPRTLQVNAIKAMLVRQFPDKLYPSQFRLIYESRELDPVDLTTESSSRSQMYGKPSVGSISLREDQWREWGDWDADSIVEAAMKEAENVGNSELDTIVNGEEVGKWNEAGVLIKEGRKWKRREVEIPSGMRSWGDSIEDGTKEARIRIEPYQNMQNL